MSASTWFTRHRVPSLVIVLTLFASGGCGGSKHVSRPPASSSTTTLTTAPPPVTAPASTAPTSTTAPVAPPNNTATSTVPPPPTTPASVVRRGDTGRRWVALTFDAGSDAGNTATILDMLAARHVSATFSLTGEWTRANPALVRRIAAAGHLIVNHTDTHDSFTGFSTHTAALSASQRIGQLERADRSIAAVTGKSTRPWFRPPYGDIDAATPADVARAGYRYVLLWTVDSLGWKGLAPLDVANRCINGATPGAILLLHVGSASTDAQALPRILDALQARGYQLVKVDAAGFVRSS